MSTNPRYKNGARRRKIRARLKAQGLPCAICGRPIDYDAPSDSEHPWSFVVDEDKPVSRYREFGFNTPEGAALDWDNVHAVHFICNQKKGTRTLAELKQLKAKNKSVVNLPDGSW